MESTPSPHTTTTTHQFKYDTLTSRWQKNTSVDKKKYFKHTMDSTVYVHRLLKNLNYLFQSFEYFSHPVEILV